MSSAVIGAVIGCVVAIGLAVGIGILWYKRTHSKERTENDLSQNLLMAEITASPLSIALPSILEGNMTFPKLDEFERLQQYVESLETRYTVYQGRRYNKNGGLNLHETVLPFDHTRVKLKKEINGCDYINATWLSKVSSEGDYDTLIYTPYVPYFNIQFMIAQDPMSHTMHHHYQMLHENGVNIVVAIKNGQDRKPLRVGKTSHFEQVTRRIHARDEVHQNLIRTEMELIDPQAEIRLRHKLVHFDFTAWQLNELSSSEETRDLLTALCLIRKEMGLEKDRLKVLVHDPEGGIGGAAVFVALYELIQMVDESFNSENRLKRPGEGCTKLEIFKIVNHMRNDRANMVNTYGYYKLLFMCLEHYVQNKSHFDHLVPKKLFTGPAIIPVENNSENDTMREVPEYVYIDDDINNDDNIEYVI